MSYLTKLVHSIPRIIDGTRCAAVEENNSRCMLLYIENYFADDQQSRWCHKLFEGGYAGGDFTNFCGNLCLASFVELDRERLDYFLTLICRILHCDHTS